MCTHVKSSSRSCFLKLTTLKLDCLGRGRGFLQRQNLGMNYPLAHFYFSSEIILAQSSLGVSHCAQSFAYKRMTLFDSNVISLLPCMIS